MLKLEQTFKRDVNSSKVYRDIIFGASAKISFGASAKKRKFNFHPLCQFSPIVCGQTKQNRQAEECSKFSFEAPLQLPLQKLGHGKITR
jgi:hypothetical protein